MSNDDVGEFLEELETCPMCGFEGITSSGCCVNCGETLSSEVVLDASPTDDRNPYWRIVTGSLIVSAFGALTVAAILKAIDHHGRDRHFHLLFATALGCVMLIGLTLLIRGVAIFVRREG